MVAKGRYCTQRSGHSQSTGRCFALGFRVARRLTRLQLDPDDVAKECTERRWRCTVGASLPGTREAVAAAAGRARCSCVSLFVQTNFVCGLASVGCEAFCGAVRCGRVWAWQRDGASRRARGASGAWLRCVCVAGEMPLDVVAAQVWWTEVGFKLQTAKQQARPSNWVAMDGDGWQRC